MKTNVDKDCLSCGKILCEANLVHMDGAPRTKSAENVTIIMYAYEWMDLKCLNPSLLRTSFCGAKIYNFLSDVELEDKDITYTGSKHTRIPKCCSEAGALST